MEVFSIAIAVIFFGAIFAASEIWINCDILNNITELITRTFFGQPVDDLNLSINPSLSAEMFCLPLTEDDLARVHACTAMKRKTVKVDLFHRMKMLIGIADLAVTYDFEGTLPDGETVSIRDKVYLRVRYDDIRSRYAHRTLTLTKVEFWQPTEQEKGS